MSECGSSLVRNGLHTLLMRVPPAQACTDVGTHCTRLTGPNLPNAHAMADPHGCGLARGLGLSRASRARAARHRIVPYSVRLVISRSFFILIFLRTGNAASHAGSSGRSSLMSKRGPPPPHAAARSAALLRVRATAPPASSPARVPDVYFPCPTCATSRLRCL